MTAPLNADELKKLIREAVREELFAAGLRIENPDHQDEARKDFTFLRRLRQGVDGAAGKIGSAVILAIVSGALFLLGLGAHSWLKQP